MKIVAIEEFDNCKQAPLLPLITDQPRSPATMISLRLRSALDLEQQELLVAPRRATATKRPRRTTTLLDRSLFCFMATTTLTRPMSATQSKPKLLKKLKGDTGRNLGKAKGKGKNKTWNSKSKDETHKSKGKLAAFVKKAVKDGLKQELKSIGNKCKGNSDDSSMDLHAVDIELQEFNYDDMEKCQRASCATCG